MATEALFDLRSHISDLRLSALCLCALVAMIRFIQIIGQISRLRCASLEMTKLLMTSLCSLSGYGSRLRRDECPLWPKKSVKSVKSVVKYY